MFKTKKIVPVKIANDGTGQCDGCGKDLGVWKWRFNESTGCTKRCALADNDYQAQEDMAYLALNVDYHDRFGDES